MLLNVLTQLAADTGYHPIQQRQAILRLINLAAKRIYNGLECNKIFRETTLCVQPDSVVSLPQFIGELRGCRMHTNELPFDLNAIGQPRYVSNTLSYKFKNWRDLGEMPIFNLPTLVGQLTLTTNTVENPPVQVSISGQTNLANRIQEVVLMDALTKTTTNLFGPRIDLIGCLVNRISDITITDANGTTLAILYNNYNRTRYKIIDVSQVFWTLDTSDGSSLIDVLYKLPLTNLVNDSDSFPAGDEYDNALYHMSMYFYYNPLENKTQDAQMSLQSALAELEAAKDGSEQLIQKKLQFGRNRYYGLFRKYRFFPGSVTNIDHNIQT